VNITLKKSKYVPLNISEHDFSPIFVLASVQLPPSKRGTQGGCLARLPKLGQHCFNRTNWWWRRTQKL